eukprot:332028-Rhodomonas_salina.4
MSVPHIAYHARRLIAESTASHCSTASFSRTIVATDSDSIIPVFSTRNAVGRYAQLVPAMAHLTIRPISTGQVKARYAKSVPGIP